jgi:hypothetical protein
LYLAALKLVQHLWLVCMVGMIWAPHVAQTSEHYKNLERNASTRSIQSSAHGSIKLPPVKPKTAGAKPASASGASGTVIKSDSGFGIAAGSSLTSLSSADLNREFSDINALGVGWVRFDLEWSQAEPRPGAYNWGPYDRVAQAAAAHGLQTLMIIDYTPSWARRGDCAGSDKCAPADPNAYGNFAAAAAAHFGPMGVSHWEIWNEPNNAEFFKPAANPSLYVALLKSANSSIKRIQPGATVVTGGTAPAGNEDGNMAPPDFVAGIYNAGGAGNFDAVAHHPYVFPYSPTTPNPYNAWGQSLSIHNIMAAHGDGAKKVWLTEFGAPTGGGSNHVTEALQASQATSAVNIVRGYPWAGPLFWYSYRDAGTSDDTVENFFGLVRNDWSHKSAYEALRNAIAQ